MARIASVNIPDNKRVCISLTYIKGIGTSLAKQICTAANISENVKTSSLTESDLALLREIIERNYVVEGALRREVSMNIKEEKRYSLL